MADFMIGRFGVKAAWEPRQRREATRESLVAYCKSAGKPANIVAAAEKYGRNRFNVRGYRLPDDKLLMTGLTVGALEVVSFWYYGSYA